MKYLGYSELTKRLYILPDSAKKPKIDITEDVNEYLKHIGKSPSPSIEELAQKLREANPWPKDSNDMYQRRISWKLCVDKLLELSKELK